MSSIVVLTLYDTGKYQEKKEIEKNGKDYKINVFVFIRFGKNGAYFHLRCLISDKRKQVKLQNIKKIIEVYGFFGDSLIITPQQQQK